MKKIKTILIYAVLIAAFIFALFPILYAVSSSFKTNSEIMTHPERIFSVSPTFDNYIQAWNSDSFRIGRMLWNSIWYTSASVVITLVSSAICGYVFSRGRFKGKSLMFIVFSSLMFIDLGSITIYPQFEILSLLKLDRSLFGLLFMSLFGIPVVNMYLVRGFINALPKEIDEAATIDGCTFTGIFFRIILPLLQPVMITIGMLAFQGSWNNYLMPAIFTMTRPEQQTLIVGLVSLKSTGAAASSWNLMLAGTTITLIPVLIVYLFGSKYFVTGIAAGAVKG